MAAPVDAGGLPGFRERGVAKRLPQRPHPLARALLGQQGHALPGRGIAVPDDQVRVRVGRVPARLVKGGQPRRPPRRQRLGEGMHQCPPPRPVELARQGDGQFVDDAGVLPVALFLRVQPSPRRVRLERHPGAEHDRLRLRPRDVADMRPGRPGRMGAPADRAHGQAVDRNGRTPSGTDCPRP